MRLTEMYNKLSSMNLASSQIQFSRVWLGRSPRYYSHLVAEQQEPGLATLVGLHWRIGLVIAHCAPSDTRSDLVLFYRQIAAHIQHRSITDIRKRTTVGEASFTAPHTASSR